MVAVSSRASFVQETSTTTGTGTYDLAGAVAGFQGFVAGNGDGEIVRYSVTDGTDWEVCEGTITDGSPDTLSRGTVLESSNAGAAVNWGAGTKTISQVLTPGEVCGKFKLLPTITLGTAGEFDFDSIPQGYKRLIIEGFVRGDVAATTDVVYAILNDLTTVSDYHSQRAYGANGVIQPAEASTPFIAVSSAASSPADAYSSIRIVLENYSSSNKKSMLGFFSCFSADTDISGGCIAVIHKTLAAAVTRIRVRADGHPTNGLVGELTLYGEL